MTIVTFITAYRARDLFRLFGGLVVQPPVVPYKMLLRAVMITAFITAPIAVHCCDSYAVAVSDGRSLEAAPNGCAASLGSNFTLATLLNTSDMQAACNQTVVTDQHLINAKRSGNEWYTLQGTSLGSLTGLWLSGSVPGTNDPDYVAIATSGGSCGLLPVSLSATTVLPCACSQLHNSWAYAQLYVCCAEPECALRQLVRR